MITLSENKEKEIINSQKFRKKLLKDIEKKKVKIGNCDNNLGVPEFKMLQIPGRGTTDNGVALLCLDKSCYIKAIMKIMPIDMTLSLKSLKTNPAIVETELLRMFTNDLIKKNVTPNIVAYYGSYDCSDATGLFKSFPYLSALIRMKKIKPTVKVMVAEYVNGGELAEFIEKVADLPTEVKTALYRTIIFEIVYTLAVLQSKYKFGHNDLHLRNILMDTDIPSGGFWSYNFQGKKFYVPNLGLMPKIWDLDFATIFKSRGVLKGRIKNAKVIGYLDTWGKMNNWKDYGIQDKFNSKYDIHMFLNGLWMAKENLTPDIVEFIEETIPKRFLGFETPYVSQGRIKKEYSDIPDPESILRKSKFFDMFKPKPKNNKDILKPEFRYR